MIPAKRYQPNEVAAAGRADTRPVTFDQIEKDAAEVKHTILDAFLTRLVGQGEYSQRAHAIAKVILKAHNLVPLCLTNCSRVKLIDAQSEYVEEGVGNIDSIVKQFDRGESSVEQS